MVQKIGYYVLKWRLALPTWQKLIQGRAEVNMMSTEVLVTESLLLDILEDGSLNQVTHAYNGTLSLDQDARALVVRSVVVTVLVRTD